MTVFAIVVLVAWCFWWIIRDDLATKATWDADIDRALELTILDADLYPETPAPITDAEAARADWDEPRKWGA